MVHSVTIGEVQEMVAGVFSAPLDPSGGEERLECGSLDRESGGVCGGLDG